MEVFEILNFFPFTQELLHIVKYINIVSEDAIPLAWNMFYMSLYFHFKDTFFKKTYYTSSSMLNALCLYSHRMENQ